MMETFIAVFSAVVLAKISELAFERYFKPSVVKQMDDFDRRLAEMKAKIDARNEPPKPPQVPRG